MTDAEHLVYDFIKENDDGRGIPAEAYYMHYCSAQFMSGQECTLSQDRFVSIVEKLFAQGYLDKHTSFAGDDIYTIKKTSVPAKGNFFASILEEFASADDNVIRNTAESSMVEFIQASAMTDGTRIFQALIIAANIGLGGVKSLTAKQKRFADFIFSKIYTGEMDTIYDKITNDIPESYYQLLELFCNLGKKEVGMPLLYYILSFAYIDGELDPDVASRLEQIFGMVLLFQFFEQDE